MIEWYWLLVAFAFGCAFSYVLIKRRVDLNFTLDQLKHTGYGTNMERHKAFRAVFLETESGKKVFREIMSWGYQFSAIRSTDPYVVATKNGQRLLAVKILTTVHAEPTEISTTTKGSRR